MKHSARLFVLGFLTVLLCLPQSAYAASVSQRGIDTQTTTAEVNLLSGAASSSTTAVGENNSASIEGGTTQQIASKKENSWRYVDGKLIDSLEPAANKLNARNGGAWSLGEYGYINSLGGVINGAHYKGIDVSEHQGEINWEAVKADGIDFAILRLGYGDDYNFQDDKQWARNVAECERLGIPYGVYLYSYAVRPYGAESGESEARHAIRLLQGHSPDLPVFLDMEDSSTLSYHSNGGINYDLTRSNLASIAEVFCETLKSHGYQVGVYANLNWFNNYLTDWRFNNYMRWVAQYNYQCDWGGDKVLWQCTSSGSVAGIQGNVDINFDYYGFCHPRDLNRWEWYVTSGSYFYASKFGYLTGFDNGDWGPDMPLTRGQLATVLWRAQGQPIVEAQHFDDVHYNWYYGSAINWARSTGIISGYENTNEFHPDEAITRQDLAVMLTNYARAMKGFNTVGNADALQAMPDHTSISSYAWDSMCWVTQNRIITGTPQMNGTSFVRPFDQATRAEASKMFMVFFRDML